MPSSSAQVGSFPIDAVRERFPSLSVCDGPKRRVYLDNPAGTQVPRSVISAVAAFYERINANIGGYFTTSRAADQLLHEVYEKAALFLGGASEREIVVGQSMTGLTFNFSRSLGRMFSAGDEVIVTRMDHDANIAPWLEMAQERGMVVRWVPFDTQTWRIEPAAFGRALSARTRLVALNYASNLTGSINDVRTLTKIAHEAGALVYVDAVQFVPHRRVDVGSLGCDFLAVSAYKFYGPHCAVVWAREELLRSLYAYKVRPLPETLPEKFEVGTPQFELLAALGACLEYCTEVSYDAILAWEHALTGQLLRGLAEIAGVTVHGITMERELDHRVPTVSFTHDSTSSATIARRLAERNIFVWSGHNFALEVARSLGLDEEDGVVRVGLAHYNTPDEIDTALDAIAAIVSP